MIFHILTIFPDFFEGPFQYGVVAKAAEAGLHPDPHPRPPQLDARPPSHRRRSSLRRRRRHAAQTRAHLRSRGKHLARTPAESSASSCSRPKASASIRKPLAAWLQYDELLLICGRYEGVDERVAEHLADEELSIGDFVLSGGELAAALVLDCVARLLPGVLGNEDSALQESFSEPGLLDCPQYTRPADFRGWKVPEVLLSGNHEEIRNWRRQAARDKTAKNRAGSTTMRIQGFVTCRTPY